MNKGVLKAIEDYGMPTVNYYFRIVAVSFRQQRNTKVIEKVTEVARKAYEGLHIYE